MTTITKLFVDNFNRQCILAGDGDPSVGQGTIAPQGSIYLRRDGGTATSLYVKTGPLPTNWTPASVAGATSVAWNDISSRPIGLVSASSQIQFLSISNIPNGLLSSSAQISYTTLSNVPVGIVSSSGQISFTALANRPNGLVSSSAQVNYTGIAGVPVGIVSSSSQIVFTALSNLPVGLVSSSAQVTYNGIVGVPTGIISSSTQVQFLSISNRPVGLMSSSAQIVFASIPSVPDFARRDVANTFSSGAIFLAKINANSGGPSLALGPGISADHTYIEFYARSSTPNIRSGYFGIPSPASSDLVLDNEMAGTVIVRTSGSVRAQFGIAGVTSTNGSYCHTSNTVMMNVASNYTQIYDISGTGLARIQVGNTGDPGNYFNNTSHVFRSRDHNTTFATITSASLSANNFVLTSDRRLKTDIVQIENALDTVDAISGYEYTMRGQATREYGVMADEVESVYPHAVSILENGYSGVAYDRFVPLLIEAMKELRAEVIQLRAKVQELQHGS